jgi:hypothetical protein
MNRLPLSVQTQYSELVQQLLHAAAEGPIVRGGSLIQKTIKGRVYWYLQQDGTRRRQTYLGPDGPELEPVLAGIRERIASARTATTDRGALVSMIAAAGGHRASAAETKIMQFLEGAGLFRLGGVLVGTHAFTTYANMLGVRWTVATVGTRDVDIVHDEHISLALAEDLGAADLESARRDAATGVELWPIPSFDRRSPSTSFKVRNTELHVDLLVPLVGRDRHAPVRLPALNAAAQPLRFLDYVIEETHPAAVVGGDGVLVNVPSPARFALHKLIVAGLRPVSHAAKARKDRVQAAQLLQVLLDDRAADVRRAFAALKKRGPGWLKHLRASLALIPSDLRGALAEVGIA